MADDRLRRITIPIPNPALAEWLVSPRCRAAVEGVTEEIYARYQQLLPIRRTRLARTPPPGHLKRSAGTRYAIGGFGGGHDRWFGYVTNSADYAGIHEYGAGRRRGYHELRTAAGLVSPGFATGVAEAAPTVRFDSKVNRHRSVKTGRFVKNPNKK